VIIFAFIFFFWVPAAAYYLVGLWWLSTVRRKPFREIVWAVSFAAMFAYTLYEGMYLKLRVEKRAQTFRELVTLAPPPADVSTLVVYREGPFGSLVGNGQECAPVCVKTLLDGRFKEFVIGFKDPALFLYPKNGESKSARLHYGDPLYYRIYKLLEQTGCKTETEIGMVGIARPLQATGRCFYEVHHNHLEGRYFELTTNDETPYAPPWKITASHLRLWDDGKSRDIARVEHAEIDLAYWFPLPGLYPHGEVSGFPTDFYPDVLRLHVSYGPSNHPIKTLQTVLGLPLDQNVRIPDAPVATTSAAADTPSFNCTERWQHERKVMPMSEGPLRLAGTYCFPANSAGMNLSSDPIVSPDGRSIAFITSQSALRVLALESGKYVDHPVRTPPPQVAPAMIAWDSGSTFLWAGSQHRLDPNVRVAPLPGYQPVATAGPGAVRMMPSLRAKQLLWAGDGYAIANLDNKAFAIIDVEHGTVKDTLTFAEIDALRDVRRSESVNYSLNTNAAAARLPDGRVRLLLRAGQWVVWTQGEKPRVLPDPFPDDKEVWLVLSPDGSRVLVARQFKQQGSIPCAPSQSGRCVFPTAPMAALAELHDLDSGKVIWTMRERVKIKVELSRPAISPDGRFALVAFPAGDHVGAAVVGMEDGRVRQELPSGGPRFTFGFARGGQTAWTYGTSVTAFYDVAND